jgi:hypothetical protein
VHVSEHSSEDRSGDTERDDQDGPLTVPDEELPEDLRPGDDNPLAQPADDDVPDDLLKETAGGRTGESSEDDENDQNGENEED